MAPIPCPVMRQTQRPPPVPRARIALLLLVAALVLLTSFGARGSLLLPETANPPPGFGDNRLYRDIAAEVTAGKNYYEVATRLQRERHYPVRPFYTVRPPLLAWASGWYGDLLWPACLLLGLATLVWLHNLEGRSIFERIMALLFLLAAGLPLVLSPFRLYHDMWGGLFAAVALGLTEVRLAVIPAMLAVLVRELNAPLLGLFTFDRRSRPFAIAALALCLVALIQHRSAVLGWTLPGDPQSQGWFGLRGPAGWVDDLSMNTVLHFLPRPAAALLAFAPLLGWAELGRHRALAWCLGVFFMVTAVARPDNSYWIQGALPVWFIGLAFVPAFLLGLMKRDSISPAALPARSETDPTSP